MCSTLNYLFVDFNCCHAKSSNVMCVMCDEWFLSALPFTQFGKPFAIVTSDESLISSLAVTFLRETEGQKENL